MKMINRISCILLVLVMVLAMSVTAFAAEGDSTITFKGREDGFEFAPGSEYTATDLFNDFKGVMPGDKLVDTVQIKNEAADCDCINLYMKAVVHDENGNPLSEKVAEAETVASMQDFLSQLTMRIYNGEQLIYEATPDQAGALVDNVLLGTLYKDETLSLKVELDVPIELGNEYARRVGEVDWVFLAECIEYRSLTVRKVWDDARNKNGMRPGSVTVTLYNGDTAVEDVVLSAANDWTYTWNRLSENGEWTVLETGIPAGYTPSYETKDDVVTITNTAILIETGQLNWPIPVLGGLGILMILFGFVMMSKKRKQENA